MAFIHGGQRWDYNMLQVGKPKPPKIQGRNRKLISKENETSNTLPILTFQVQKKYNIISTSPYSKPKHLLRFC